MIQIRNVVYGAVLSAGLVLCFLLAQRQALAGQAPQTAVPTAAQVSSGRDAFTTNCSFCHGSDARGGAEGGPNLTTSALVIGDTGGKQLGEFLKVGRPPRMPMFSLPEKTVSDISAYLHSQIASVQRAGASDPRLILVGDAAAGQAYFQQHCTQCHSVTGNLKGIGSKYDPVILQGRIAVPKRFGESQFFGPHADKRFPPEAPRTVTITEPGKAPVHGDLVYISIFDVTYRDAQGDLHTVERHEDEPKVVVTDPAQPHIDMLKHLSNTDLHNLTAYLVTIR